MYNLHDLLGPMRREIAERAEYTRSLNSLDSLPLVINCLRALLLIDSVSARLHTLLAQRLKYGFRAE